MAVAPRPTDDLVVVVCSAVRAIQRTIACAAVRTGELINELVGPGGAPEIVHAAAVTLLSPVHGLELRVKVGGDVRALASRLLGDANDAHTYDLLAELANLAMGSLKLELGPLAFTSGVPERLPARAFRGSEFAYADEIALDCGIYVRIALRARPPRFVAPRELREGMVLASDLRNPQGVLLAPTGTRLSMHMLERLAGTLAPSAKIEVSVA